MSADSPPIGIFTTDDRLVVRAWDAWLARATGISAEHARSRPLPELIPDLASRGILAVFENVLAGGTVEVLAPALHHHLIPCAPVDPVPGFGVMQQHVTIGPLRDDGRIVGTIVTVEDVTARVARERTLAAKLLEAPPDAAAVSASSGTQPPEQVDRLTGLLADDDWRVRQLAVRGLAEHGSTVVDSLVRTLRTGHENLNVLSSALDLLAISDIDVVMPLVHCLDQSDTNLRIQAALILGERRDRRAIGPLIRRLDDPDANVRFHVIEALGRLNAVEAADALLAAAEQRDFFLSFPAIQALARVGNPSIAPRLVPLLADELLRAPTIEALGELGDEDVTTPLVQLLNTSRAPVDVLADALAGLYDRYESSYGAGEHIAGLVRRSISATGTQRILDAVQQVGAERLAGLAKVLSWLEGDAVQRALTRLLGHSAVRAQVVESLVRHGSGVVALLIEQLRAEDLDTRQAAAVALGRIGDRRATQALINGLADPELVIAAAGALARIGDRAAYEPLMALLRHSDSAARQAAIAALNSIGHPAMPLRIANLLEDADPIARESAARIAGYFGYPECLDAMLHCCRDRSEQVQRAAIESLAFFDDRRVLPVLASALEAGSPSVRAAAAAAVGQRDEEGAGGVVARALDDPDPWVRFVALRSIASTGHRDVAPRVLDLLQHDPAPHVRLGAIEALGRLGVPEALAVIEGLAQSPDPELGGTAIRALGHIPGPEALRTVERFLRASEGWQRASAVAAAMLRCEPQAVDLLQWAAAADQDPDVVVTAIDGLAKLARRQDAVGPRATRAVVALTSEAAVREAAVRCLSELPGRRIDDVAAGLHHPSPHVRCAVVEALGRMKQAAASHALESALDDAEAPVRLAAVQQLKQLGTTKPRRKLLELARTDADHGVRRAAMFAAARSGHSEAAAPDAG